jgi:exonuclease SbcD
VTRLAHLADVHLGHRQGYRCTPTGINQREADVAHAFRSAVDGILAAKPDVVLLAGDLFHSPKAPNAAIIFAFDQLQRLRDAGLPVVLVAGNHDLNKSVETGCILHLFKRIGVQLAIDGPQVFDYPALGLSVTAVPDHCDLTGIQPGEARHRVLLIHGQVEGTCPWMTNVIPREIVEDERWSAICLGDYHIQHQVAPRAWYAGSLEYTSSDVWSEAATPKGWLLWDLEAGTVEPQPVPTREVLDLPDLDATGMTPAEVDAALAEQLADIAGKIVRLKVLNLSSALHRQLDHRQIKKWRAEAMILKLDFLRPERVSAVSAARTRGQTLNEIVAAFLGSYEFSPGIDRAKVAGIGAEVMAEAQEAEQNKLAGRGAA